MNGFNFPSVDSDGDALRFAEMVAKAIEILPDDVVIVSGHNDTGTWQDLHAYHDMLVQTTDSVRRGLAEGKDLATLQEEKILAKWESYAKSYVSVDGWTEYLADAFQEDKEETGKKVYEPLYYTWKGEGAQAAVERYYALKRDHAEEYQFDEFNLMAIGIKLLGNDHTGDAVIFLQASLKEYPDSQYSYYTNYKLADAFNKLGDKNLAVKYCEMSVELKPDFAPATRLLGELGKE